MGEAKRRKALDPTWGTEGKDAYKLRQLEKDINRHVAGIHEKDPAAALRFVEELTRRAERFLND